MITVICKKIDSGKDPDGGLRAYARDLLAYMTNPEKNSDDGRLEKCVATKCHGFSSPMPTVLEMSAELLEDCQLSKHVKAPISHWVMSWKCTEGENIPTSSIFDAIDDWRGNMGYGGDGFKYVISIHKDTNYIHAHICKCRVDGLTGTVPDRRWWKLDNQKALAEIAGKFGWEVEEGARFKPKQDKKGNPVTKDIAITHPITGKKTEKNFCAIEAKKPGKSAPHPGDKAERLEHYRGIKSQKTMLQDRLSEAYASMQADLHTMKWGQIHQRLAIFGIQMERREHAKDQFGLVFSLDGEHWHAASTVCPEMTWPKLNGSIGAKKDSWRNASKDITAILEEARKKYAEVEPTRKSIDIVFQKLSKEEVDALRAIPVEEARAAMERAGVKLTPDGKARTAIDVAVKEGKLSFPEAVMKLAELFPEKVEALRKEPKEDEDPQNLIPAWWQALQLDHIVYEKRFYSLKAFVEKAPSMDGYAELFWAAQERALQKAFQTDFCRDYPPSCILDTPRGPRAFWVVTKKYPENDFYRDFERYLQTIPKETLGLPPLTKVVSSTPRKPVEMEDLIDQYRLQWLKEKAAEKAAKCQEEEEKPEPWTAEELQEKLRWAKIPSWMEEYGEKLFAHMQAEAQEKGMSRVHWDMTRLLYRAGARPAEVFSYIYIFMVRHSKKLKDLGLLDYDPAASPEDQKKYERWQAERSRIMNSLEQQAKKLTARLAPRRFLESRQIWREKPGGFRLDVGGFLVSSKAKDTPMPPPGVPIPAETEKKRRLSKDFLMRPLRVARDVLRPARLAEQKQPEQRPLEQIRPEPSQAEMQRPEPRVFAPARAPEEVPSVSGPRM